MLADAKRWEDWYMQTILEVSGQKMPERISATRRAIATKVAGSGTRQRSPRGETRNRERTESVIFT